MKNFLVVFSLCVLVLTGCQAKEQGAGTLSLQGGNDVAALSLGMTQAEVEEQLGTPVDCYTPEDWAGEGGSAPIFQEDNQGDSLSRSDEAFFYYENGKDGPIYITYDDRDCVDSISTYCLYANRSPASFLWHIGDAVTYGTTLDAIKTVFPDAAVSTDESLGYCYVQVTVGDDGLLAVLSDEKVELLSLCPKDALFL